MTNEPLQAATPDQRVLTRPAERPLRPQFSSGPCVKRPGWSPEVLKDASLGRSHRSKPAKAKLKAVIDECRAILGLPDDYRLGIVPASDTGAMELALWSLLGTRGVDMFAWESFGAGWVTDTVKQLKLEDVRIFKADYGQLPDLGQYNGARDCVFTWNGTTSGVRVPDADWIPADREGLTICDATSAAFAMDLAWDKLDVTTFSWQKALGGEAAHGMIVLSPRAVERLENYTPPWPLPKIFTLAKGGKLIEGIFSGATINTPSLLATEDFLDTLGWAKSIGGLPGLKARVEGNAAAVDAWVEASDWIAHLAVDAASRSTTSICLSIDDPWFAALGSDDQAKAAKQIATLLEQEGIAFDVGAYRDAPCGLRLWAGATMEQADLEALFPWLDWAFAQVKASA